MKRSQTVRLLLMGAAPVFLTACEPEEPVSLYKDVAECVAGAKLTQDQCQAAFDHAKSEHERVAPRYSSQSDCETDFGSGRCHTVNHGAGIQYIPLMAAYALGYYAGRPNYYQSQPLYYSHTTYGSGGYLNSGGQPIARTTGDARVTRSAMETPSRAVTMSRSGFGSSSSARGSWGGS
ncbi:DUF1190 domain-containing protein [Tahibacter amnicola]|uniref:DUF1190 domain-containing protein n=1 Tax=Tahibacter amnicola TaxID=2976241 RepID=A0ABY6BB96_9GAMM|nr:DUF1190 domain-containing protein [Tahibacter amnicola]UXI67328.1 DUF1190 domain-containing protein [Tahibacter amnicola]